MNIKEIKELVKMLDGTDISELTLENEGNKVVIKKGANVSNFIPQMSPTVSLPMQTMPAPVHIPTAQTAVPSGEEKGGLKPNQEQITAPMVGTFYRAPSPDADPYVQNGQTIEVGQVVCIIEAMKLMNEIESEIRGKIVQILVDNATPVEYGQPLFIIEKI